MNRKRRKKITDVIESLNNCVSRLEDVKEEEDDSRSEIPENLQNGDSYIFSEECSDKIDDALEDIKGAVSTLEEIL